MHSVTVSPKLRVVIPHPVRDNLNLGPDTKRRLRGIERVKYFAKK